MADYGYDRAPVARPPGPGPGSPTPSGAQPVAVGEPPLTCYPHDANTRTFLDVVRGIILDEWVRALGSTPVMASQRLDELMGAMSVGRVIPGFRIAADGQCFMYWNELACFSRWYARLYAEERGQVLDALADGSSAPWTDPGEVVWPPSPELCTAATIARDAAYCQEYPSPDGTCPQYCCPEEVYRDPAYDPETGKWAKELSGGSGSKWTGVAIFGATAVAAIGAVLLVAAGRQ